MPRTEQSLRPGASLLAGLCLVFALACSVPANCDEFTDWLEKEYQGNREWARSNPDLLLHPGLLADRKHRSIDLWAVATGAAGGHAIDSLVATPGSDTTASIATTPVNADAIHNALEFIGVQSGYVQNVRRGEIWPKGERVIMTFHWDDADSAAIDRSIRAEQLIVDQQWQSPLPEQGFRFVGAAEKGSRIGTLFNAADSLLEVPYIAGRSQVRGRLVVNPAFRFAAGQKIRIRIRPEYRDDRQRVADFFLDISAGEQGDATRLNRMHVVLAKRDESQIVDGNFESVYVHLEQLIKNGAEPYLQLRFDDALPLGAVRLVAQFAHRFLMVQGIRFERLASQAYYGVFLPDVFGPLTSGADAAQQPVEIRLVNTSAATGKISWLGQTANGASGRQLQQFADLGELQAQLQGNGKWNSNTVVVSADATMRYGDFRKIHDVLQRYFQNIYVYL